jgi:DNA polymerase III subunit epsilon
VNFVAIDFETANHYRHSACSLGAIVVENGQIVAQKYWLIRPEPFEMNYFHHRVHGITLEQLENERTFDQIYHEVRATMEDQVMVAHNVNFDAGVLTGVLHYYDLAPIKTLKSMCTVQTARRVWPGEPSYSLGNIATSKGIKFSHHHALDDARACAELLLLMAKDLNVNTIEEMNDALGKIKKKK